MTVKSILILLLFLIHCLLFFSWIPDDAFISLRVSANIANGDGAVFNPGDRVEGHTSPLWVFLLAPLALLGIPLDWAGRVVGILCGAILVERTMTIGRRHLSLGYPYDLLTAGILAVSFPLAFYASSAMETVPYALLLLLAVAEYLSARPAISKKGWILLAALALTRPEGVVFGLLFAAGGWSRDRRHFPWRDMVLCYVLPLLLVGLARYYYYGDILPNSFYAKVGGKLIDGQRWIVPLAQLGQFSLVSGSILVIPLGLIAMRKEKGKTILLGALPLIQVGINLIVGGDILAYHRFMVPMLPILAWLVGLGVRSAIEGWRPGYARLALVLVFGSIYLANAAYSMRHFSREVPRDIYDYWMHSGRHRDLGKYIQSKYAWAGSLVINEVGAVGYYSGLTTYDMNGLVDREVGRIWYRGRKVGPAPEAPEILGDVARVLLSRNPDIVVLPSFKGLGKGPGEMHPLWRAFKTDPLFEQYYSEVETITLIEGLEKTFYVRKSAEGGPHGGQPARTGDSAEKEGKS